MTDKKDVETAAEVALGFLVRYIRKQDLAVGDSLPGELDLVNLIGVGRSTVREALAALKALGIISSRRKGGITIERDPLLLELRPYLAGSYSDHQIYLDASEFRGILERGLAEDIFNNSKSDTRETLAALLTTARTALETDEEADLFELEMQFHQALIRNCTNRLALMLTSLYEPIFNYNRGLWPEGRLPQSRLKSWIAEHESLLQELEKGSSKSFVEALAAHTKRYVKGQ